MMTSTAMRTPLLIGATALCLGLAACKGSGGSDSVTVAGDVPIAYAMRVNSINTNPLSGAPTAPGGDLIIRELSSPSAPEHNITSQFTQGQGDVLDPEVSFDGKKIVFAMNCPASNTSTIGGLPACTGHWNIWEYDTTVGGLAAGTFRRITNTSSADDVHPAYLPGAQGFVFSSNRQTKSYANQALGQSYYALDEYERERVFNLHTMDVNGNNIQQISFNQSHDRNPVVRPNGDIMYSRWDHVGDRNRFTIFRAKPDGTDMFVLYGAHSDGNSFLHPRDMDPAGKYAGKVVTDLMPLDRTHEGGALMLVDLYNYSEQNTPANANVPAIGGETQMTSQALNYNTGPSPYGRVTAPYPLWDGTDRILVSFAPCEVTNAGVVVSCSTLSSAELAALGDPNRLLTVAKADPVQDNVPPSYAVYMFDPAAQTWRIVAAPPAGFMYVHPVALQARTAPNVAPPTTIDTALASQNLAKISIRSVYDTDDLGRMGDPVIAAADERAGCTTIASVIAKRAPPSDDPGDARALVADLARIKNPTDSAYLCAPARFVRAVRAVAPPSGTTGLRTAIGDTNFEPQQILGYAPIEPDGSFELTIPPDTPIGLQVVDSEGRAFQTHTNWIQARPGEVRTCDGCHGPRRGGALNSAPSFVDSVPPAAVLTINSQTYPLSTSHIQGETMAQTHTRLDPTALQLVPDPVYVDIWASTSYPGAHARPSIDLAYTHTPASANDLATAVPTQGIINYPDHIQPLWSLPRGTNGANTCTNCHTASDPAGIDLLATTAGTGRLTSYESLLVGAPVIDPTTGLPVTVIQDGVPVVQTGPALVNTAGSEGDAVGMSRKSRLVEIMAGEILMSDSAAQAAYPNPPASPNHATMLNAAEKRLIAEWIDTGGKYYNNPFATGSTVRNIATLDKTVYAAQVWPIQMKTCAASCHQAIGSAAIPAGSASSFVDNRFVLTGNVDGDFNQTLTMINNVCSAASNPLLQKPSTIPHPPTAVGQTAAVLPAGSADYTTIANWIASGCTP